MTVDLVKRIVAALLFALLVLPPFFGWVAVRRIRGRAPPPASDADPPPGSGTDR